MSVTWRGDALKKRATRASIVAVDATMQAAILHAKANHGAGAHAFQRFETQTGELERGTRIVEAAKRMAGGIVRGIWGVIGLIYARRIELGFQGVDSAGRAVDAPPFPYLQPGADVEYPKLAGRVRRAFARGLG